MSERFIMADAKQLIKGDTRRNPRAFRNLILSQKKRQHFFSSVACSLFIPSRVGEEELRDYSTRSNGFFGATEPRSERLTNSWAWKRESARLACVDLCSLARQSR